MEKTPEQVLEDNFNRTNLFTYEPIGWSRVQLKTMNKRGTYHFGYYTISRSHLYGRRYSVSLDNRGIPTITLQDTFFDTVHWTYHRLGVPALLNRRRLARLREGKVRYLDIFKKY